MRPELVPLQCLTPLSVDAADMQKSTFKQLSDTIKNSDNVNEWLEAHRQLTPRDKWAAGCLRLAYRRKHGLTDTDLLNGNIELWLAWQRGASLESCATCAAIWSRLLEQGAFK